MIPAEYATHLNATLDEIRSAGLYKSERTITTAQRAKVHTAESGDVLNLCANNYLGLAGWILRR